MTIKKTASKKRSIEKAFEAVIFDLNRMLFADLTPLQRELCNRAIEALEEAAIK